MCARAQWFPQQAEHKPPAEASQRTPEPHPIFQIRICRNGTQSHISWEPPAMVIQPGGEGPLRKASQSRCWGLLVGGENREVTSGLSVRDLLSPVSAATAGRRRGWRQRGGQSLLEVSLYSGSSGNYVSFAKGCFKKINLSTPEDY